MSTYVIMRETGYGKDGYSVGDPIAATTDIKTAEKHIEFLRKSQPPGDHTFYYYECVRDLDKPGGGL